MSRRATIPSVRSNEVAPPVPGVRSARPVRGFLIGKFPTGDIKTVVLAGEQGLRTDYGGMVPGSAAYDAASYLNQGAQDLYIVRVKGTAATISIVDRELVTPVAKLKLTALVDGTWANHAAGPPVLGMTATVADGSLAGTFKLTVTWYRKTSDTESETFVEVFDSLALDPAAVRYFQTIINAQSKLVVAEDLAPANHTSTYLPAAGTVNLAGGVEPNYTEGIALISEVKGRCEFFVDTDDASVNAALVAAVNARTPAPALVDGSICLLNCPQYSTVSAMEIIGNGFVDGRTFVTGAWLLSWDSAINLVRPMRPAGFLAGVRAVLPEHKSVTNKRVLGVVGAERNLTRANLTALRTAGIVSIDLDPDDPTAGVRVISGDLSDGTESLVRMFRDWQGEVGAASLAWCKGELQGDTDPDPTRVAVTAMFTSYLEDLKSTGIIERYKETCSLDNNTLADIADRKLHNRRSMKLRNVIEDIVEDLIAGTESVIAREG